MGQDRGAITRNRSAVWTRTGVLSPEAGVQFGSGQGCHHQRRGDLVWVRTKGPAVCVRIEVPSSQYQIDTLVS